MSDVLTDVEGFKLASELMIPLHETYDPSRNRDGELGAYGFLHDYSWNEQEGIGAVYDFPFEEDTSFHGRVKRPYAQWLDDLVEVTGAEVNPGLRDATVRWLSYLVWARPIDKRLGVS